jgi:hypothetical protein
MEESSGNQGRESNTRAKKNRMVLIRTFALVLVAKCTYAYQVKNNPIGGICSTH